MPLWPNERKHERRCGQKYTRTGARSPRIAGLVRGRLVEASGHAAPKAAGIGFGFVAGNGGESGRGRTALGG